MDTKLSNVQIAAFIVFTLTISSSASYASADLMINGSQATYIPAPAPELSPVTADTPLICRYAGPPGGNIKIETGTSIYKPNIMRYAGPPSPANPIKIIDITQPAVKIDPPIVRYAGPPASIEQKIDAIKATETISAQQNLTAPQAKFNTDGVRNINLNTANVTNDTFIYTDYGSVKVLQPFAHYVFK